MANATLATCFVMSILLSFDILIRTVFKFSWCFDISIGIIGEFGSSSFWFCKSFSVVICCVTKDNYSTYVRKVMNKANMSMGGTNYAPVLKEMVSYYKDIEPSEVPAFIIFITDGENWDTNETNKIVKELSNYNMFVQFIGIGDESFYYLRSLDHMEGRKHERRGRGGGKGGGSSRVNCEHEGRI